VAFATTARRPLVGVVLAILVVFLLIESLAAREPNRSRG
jgi:hypothetical protein